MKIANAQQNKIIRKIKSLEELAQMQLKILEETKPSAYGYENIKGRYEATILDIQNAKYQLKNCK